MVFAAGFGTRMGALTAERPKPLIPVAGRPLIDRALALAEGQGVARIVVNAHYRAGQVAAHLAGRPGVTVRIEAPAILDTGGGLHAARGDLGPGPVFTLNADAVFTGPNPLATLRAAWDPARMDALLLLVPPARARGRAGRGDFSHDAAGRIARGGALVYTGAQIVRPERLDPIAAELGPAFSLNRLWDALIAEGRAFGALHPGGWADVGHPAGIAAAEALLSEAGDA
jgi:MurNAc alpha-1-phosphate uridylyltransferase